MQSDDHELLPSRGTVVSPMLKTLHVQWIVCLPGFLMM